MKFISLVKLQMDRDAKIAEELLEAEAAKNGALFECQCCFGDYMWEKISQCSDGHLFCGYLPYSLLKIPPSDSAFENIAGLECCQRNAEIQVN